MEVIKNIITDLKKNCNSKEDCPTGGICNLKNVVFLVTIFPKENVKDKKVYIGILLISWKLRYNNLIYSFSHKCLKNQTALSGYFWKLKNRGLTPKIQWKILKRSTTRSWFDGRCNLCLEEKIQIMLYIDPFNLWNQKYDFIAR